MAATKHASTDVADDGLNALIAGVTKIVVFDGSGVSDPPTPAEITGAALHDFSSGDADITLTGPTGAENRAATVPPSNELTVNQSGTADGVALMNTGGTVLWYTTTISNPQAVVSGNKITIGQWTITINQPT